MVARRRRQKWGMVPERRVVSLHNVPTTGLHAIETPKLLQSQCRLQIRHVVFESWLHDVVSPFATGRVPTPGFAIHSMQAEDASPLEKLSRSCQHSSFTRCQILCRIEAERGKVRASADGLAIERGTNGVRRIFNQMQAVLIADGSQGVQFNRVTRIVDCDNSFGLRSDSLLDGVRLKIQCIGFYVHKDWRGSDVFNHIDRSRKCHGRCDHFVARADIEDLESDMQSSGAGVQ